jgi:hypothetical protein
MYLLFTFLSISCLNTILKWSAEDKEKIARVLLWNQFKYREIKWSSSELQDECSIMRWAMVINCAVIAIQIVSWTWKQYTQFVMNFTRRKNLGINDEIDIHHWINKLFLKIKMSTPKILFCIQVQSVKENSSQLK